MLSRPAVDNHAPYKITDHLYPPRIAFASLPNLRYPQLQNLRYFGRFVSRASMIMDLRGVVTYLIPVHYGILTARLVAARKHLMLALN